MPLHRLRQGSKYMERDEIEQILRIQWKSLHSGSAYHEDYYFQVLILFLAPFSGGTWILTGVFQAWEDSAWVPHISNPNDGRMSVFTLGKPRKS